MGDRAGGRLCGGIEISGHSDSPVNGRSADYPNCEEQRTESVGAHGGDERRKCAVEEEVVSLRRHGGGKFEWPEARRRYRSLFPRETLVKESTKGVSIVACAERDASSRGSI